MQETPTKSSLLLATEEEEEEEAAFVPRYRNLKNVFEIAELLEKKVNLRAGTSGLQIPNWRGLYSPSCCEIRQPLIIMVKKGIPIYRRRRLLLWSYGVSEPDRSDRVTLSGLTQSIRPAKIREVFVSEFLFSTRFPGLVADWQRRLW